MYERVTQTSNGQIYEIINADIEQILNDVTAKLDDHHELLTTSYKSGKGSDRWNFIVDDTISKIHVMIAGEKPLLWVYDPSHKGINGTETVKLENVKSLTVEHPATGTWEIECVTAESHSIRITADSRLSFSYGFSVQPTNSLSDASLTPLNGRICLNKHFCKIVYKLL